MSVIYREELSTANSSNMLEILNDLRIDSQILSDKIMDFTSNFDYYLIGNAAPIIKNKWETLLDALKKQDTICENLISNIKAANNTMIGYVENYDMIDDSKKEEISMKLCQIDNNIDSLKNYAKEMTKEESNKLYYDIQELGSQRDILQRYYDKIKGLGSQVESAYSQISDVVEDIANYSEAIGKVNSGIRGAFLHPGNRDILYYSQEGYFIDGICHKWESKWRSDDNKDIAESGCGPTSLAMVIGTILQDSSITPEVIADIMNRNNSAGERWGNHDSVFVENVSNEFGLNCCDSASFDADAVEEVIKAGGAFMRAAFDERIGGQHYKAITDVVYKDGKRYFVVCDPFAEDREPKEVPEQEFYDGYKGTNIYITPSNVEIGFNSTIKKIDSLTDTTNDEVVWRRN